MLTWVCSFMAWNDGSMRRGCRHRWHTNETREASSEALAAAAEGEETAATAASTAAASPDPTAPEVGMDMIKGGAILTQGQG